MEVKIKVVKVITRLKVPIYKLDQRVHWAHDLFFYRAETEPLKIGSKNGILGFPARLRAMIFDFEPKPY